MQKRELQQMISSGRWLVEFTKVDGSNSTMECTLDKKLIPVFPEKQEKTNMIENDVTLRVYSLDRHGWRSFRTANVINLHPIPHKVKDQD